MVETALVISIVVMVLLLTIDFGRVYFAHVSLRNAAREAAIYGGSEPLDGCPHSPASDAPWIGLQYTVAKEMRLGSYADVGCGSGGEVRVVTAGTDAERSGCFQFTAPATYAPCTGSGPWSPTLTLIYRVRLQTDFEPVSPFVGLLTGNGFGNAVPMSAESSSPVLENYGS
jgi:hypothetical protein